MENKQKITDSNTPLHLLQPDYEIAYSIPSENKVTEKLEKVLLYLEAVTPAAMVDSTGKTVISDFSEITTDSRIQPGDFRLTSYEWGVTYLAMLHAGEVTHNRRFSSYTINRMNFLKNICPVFKQLETENPGYESPVHSVLFPSALDDAGALCASMLKAQEAEDAPDYSWMINNFIDFIRNKQYRFADRTLARNRPHPNTLWIDDLFMSVPALARMGKSSGNSVCFDDAIKQVDRFEQRMYDTKTGLFLHGWVQEMEEHPKFFWGRANGWAMLSMVELLDAIPESHPDRKKIIDLLKKHIKAVAALQSTTGFWHQLLNRSETYPETSATAIFTYCIAWTINQGYLGAKEYGPMVILGWNAVNSKISNNGQVEGTCVGTGMGFDLAFYSYRPVSLYAAHGYGPVVLAGAEIIRFIRNYRIELNENALQIVD